MISILELSVNPIIIIYLNIEQKGEETIMEAQKITMFLCIRDYYMSCYNER